MPILYGVSPSPFVRKAMLAHAHKNIPYDLKITLPSSDDEDFRQASPIGKIPAYRADDGVGFADSSVIVAYLERTSSNNALYPKNDSEYAVALWFEEWGDSALSSAINALYFQRVVGPAFFNHVTDSVRVEEILTDLIPQVLDILESRLTENSWLVGEQLSIADITVGSCLVSLLHANYQIEQSRWPKLANYNERFLALPIVQAQIEAEKAVMNRAAG
jgi:glutathione S-transferase